MAPLTVDRCRALAAPHLEADERILHAGHAIEPPWWSHLLRLGGLFWRHYALVATDRRLLLVEHGATCAETGYEAIPWSEIAEARLGRGLLARALVVEAPARRFHRRLQVPRLSLDDNWAAAEGVVATWAARRHAPSMDATG
jgi:hypothetical protein